MGVYFEEKLLLAKKDGNDLEKIYYEGLARIEKLFDKYDGTIRLERIDLSPTYDIKNLNSKPIPPIALPTEYPFYLDSMGAINVRYSKGAPQRQGKSIIYPVNKLFVSNFLTVTRANKDFAWILFEVSNFVRMDGKEDLGNAAFLKIDDPKEEIRGKASEVKRIAQVDSYLMFDDSIILNKQSLQLIADKFGIDIEKSDSVEMSAYLIREDILAGDKTKNNDVNSVLFLDFAKKLKNKLNKTAGVVDPPTNLRALGEYTSEYLENLSQKDRNNVAKKLEVKMCPPITKVDQIAEILEKQANSEQ